MSDSGARAERQAKHDLEASGFVCMKAGGSLGVFDLLAFSEQGVRGVQVKRDDRYGGSGANVYPAMVERMREEMAALPLPPGMTGELWVMGKVKNKLAWLRQEVLVRGGQLGGGG